MGHSVVLLGFIGSGKTTLYNKLTHSNEIVKSGGDSVTQSCFLKQSCYGSGFKVLDTPGFGCNSNKIQHVAGVLAALAEGPLNRIIILLKFDRTDTMINQLKVILPAFCRYRVMITVIVTFWDQCLPADAVSNQKSIEEKLEKFNIKSVIFVGSNNSAEEICRFIDKELYNSYAQKIELTDTELLSNFDLSQFDEGNMFELECAKGDLTTQYENFRILMGNHIKQIDVDVKKLPDYLRALTNFAQNKVNILLGEFEKKNQKLIDNLTSHNQLKAFLIHFNLKKSLLQEYQSIVQMASAKMKTKNDHCYKYIKKCPYCGEIWIKVSGCSGPTICGRILDSKQNDDLINGEVPNRFEVNYVNNQIIVKDLGTVANITDDKKKKIEQNLKVNDKLLQERQTMQLGHETFQVGRIGCKRTITWSDMKELSPGEMNELVDEKLLDYFDDTEKELEKRNISMQNLYEAELKLAIEQQQNEMRARQNK